VCPFNPELLEVLLSGQDCNRNGVDDGIDIGLETSADENENGIPDKCEFKPIPTFSNWGLVATVLALTAGTILYGRRRWARL
jgi:hypothetical protein